MTATKDYFVMQIAEIVGKALGLPVTVEMRGNEVEIVVAITGDGAKSPFWSAVLEQADKADNNAGQRSAAPERQLS